MDGVSQQLRGLISILVDSVQVDPIHVSKHALTSPYAVVQFQHIASDDFSGLSKLIFLSVVQDLPKADSQSN